MRMTHFFSQTRREAPAEAETANHQLLLRAGYIRPHAAGIFSYLPLAVRSMEKIKAIMRQEIEAIGGQEMTMPVVTPADLWKETGRWYDIGPEMGRLQDRSGRDLALAMTHEELVTDLARSEIRSHRQLPALVYHIQTKWRDDPRPRGGLVRVREFTMLDSYSLDADWEGLDAQYRRHYQAYFNIFGRCGLPVHAVRSDTGMMGGQLAHEFMYLTPIGEDSLLFCDGCGYSANRQIARFAKPQPEPEALAPLQKVATPDATTIEALARFLDVPRWRTAKAVFLMAGYPDRGQASAAGQLPPDGPPAGHASREKLVFAIIRGDMEVNETKLANTLGARSLRPATEAEIRQVGAVPGYASPVGLDGVQVVVDDLIPQAPNLVAGANEAGYHLVNVNYPRDFQAGWVADIAAAQEGDPCPNCGRSMRMARGVEVGNLFKLGTRYSQAMGAAFLDRDGQMQPVIMGSYGIGVGRLLACVAEHCHDERGLAWPVTVAPFQVHLVRLASKTGQTGPAAEKIYQELASQGIEVLFDDREESAGVKFMDADLIGIPLRLTVGDRGLQQGGVEIKRRTEAAPRSVALEELAAQVRAEIEALQAEIAGEVSPVEYPET
jgi:prolyl-tRNA synthetase